MTLIFVVILTALVFEFINGFHDSANSIATIVGTRVLSPQAAVVWAAVFNFAAAFLGGTEVAKAICAECVVRSECLDYSLEIKEPHGIWGGLNPSERGHVRRRVSRGGAVALARWRYRGDEVRGH